MPAGPAHTRRTSDSPLLAARIDRGALEDVAALASEHPVLALAAGEGVLAGLTEQPVAACLAQDLVLPRPATDDVIAAAGTWRPNPIKLVAAIKLGGAGAALVAYLLQN